MSKLFAVTGQNNRRNAGKRSVDTEILLRETQSQPRDSDRNLGEDMEIPFGPLPSVKQGWRDGLEFAEELEAWTRRYEEEVARPTGTNDQYVRVYVDSAFSRMPAFVGQTVRKMLGQDLDDVMRESLW
ncbi:hypothetical protein Daus18300_002043 [Diaporthe australafricana]|uniref:Uncharacterized protein n=1 Tax=Diaporthe australafricana TaxID=127596 RepID=A0ABR3XT49_9PEZI